MTELRQRQPRVRDERHLRFIRTLACLATGRAEDVDAAHIRFSDMRFGKRETGKGERPDDKWTVPLSRDQHADQHRGSERKFWERHGIDPLRIAQELYSVSGDTEAGEAIIRRARHLAEKVRR